jgi:FkbM family methyltransferase
MKKHLSSVVNLIKLAFSLIFSIEVIITNYFLGKRKFYCNSKTEFFRTANYGNEEEFLGAFIYLLRDNDIVLDIGASIGIVSIYAAPHVKEVIAFEPDKEIFNKLNKNIELNQMQKLISTHNIGISDSQGEVLLNTDGIDGFSPSIANLSRHGEQVKINVDSIDNLISKNVIPYPTILKIDIEGAESLALSGAQKLLSSKKKPRLLFIEIHPSFLKEFNSSSEEVLNKVLNYGYAILTYSQRDDQIHLTAIINDL